MRWPWSTSPRHRNHRSAPESTARATAGPGAVDTTVNPGPAAGDVSDDVIDVGHRFRQAWIHGDTATANPELLPVRLARACVAVLPVTGAGLSLLNDDFRVPLGASDDAAETAERLQFTQGEGPCLNAARSGRVVIAQAEQIEPRWPAFGEQFFQQTPFRAAISIPLPLTADQRGALDLYLNDADQVEQVSLAAVTIIS